MPTLTRRNGDLSRTLGSYLAPAAGYTVVAFEPGAEAVSVSTVGGISTITVRAGHGFAANDKILNVTANTYSGVVKVSSVTATTLVMSGTFTPSAGDVLFNVGQDGPAVTYQTSGVTIYSDMAGGSSIQYSQVTTNAQGEYGYWASANIWELVLSGSTVVEYILDVSKNPMCYSNSTGFEVFIGPDFPSTFSSLSGARGIYINKPSSASGAMAINFARDGNERWSLGEDTATGDRSFFALWSDRAEVSGAAWITGDILGIAPGGTDTNAQDPPKWVFNGNWGAAPYDSSYAFEFRMAQSLESGGSSLYTALFNCDNATSSASGGVVIQTANTRPSLVLRTISTNKRYAAVQFGRYSGGALLGFEIGTDIVAKNDTQVFTIYDAVAAAHRFAIDADGDVGIGNTTPDNILRIDRNQNAATRVVIGNNSTGTAGRSGFYAGDGSTGTSVLMERFSTGFTGDTTLQGDGMVYTSGAAMLHLGTNGAKRVTILDSAAKLGIGVDPPTEALDVAGAIKLTTHIEGTEIAEPAAPAANGFRLFAKDNGAGKTQLCVRFATGATQVIATEP